MSAFIPSLSFLCSVSLFFPLAIPQGRGCMLVERHLLPSERIFWESNVIRLLIPFLSNSSFSSWLIVVMLLGAMKLPAFSGEDVSLSFSETVFQRRLILPIKSSCCSFSWVLRLIRLVGCEGLGMCPVKVWFVLPSVGDIIEIPWSMVRGELLPLNISIVFEYAKSHKPALVRFGSKISSYPSVGLDFRARLDGGRMYSGHLEAMRLP
ncbi:hypothetical protein Tco_0404222 [Tanacetum coccineum]